MTDTLSRHAFNFKEMVETIFPKTYCLCNSGSDKEQDTHTDVPLFQFMSTSGLMARKHRWSKILQLTWDGCVDNKQQKE